ncbi:GH3 auxin-responsive promoter [Ekhidna lutea]|uniref:GH3 auxin-responsive promoter n=1 Tax=Ekhidna lutea TaxID=447679 RepID=A0A239GK53_EKHLU|nr:GH3 auxin-responsive promoter family protein [Ekhidna lutea]SNS69255.1 GH3 auxin-responsive promoter [Ekhidna lutea]
MALLGNLIKTGIELNQKLSFDLKSSAKQQEDQLISLLNKAKSTAFGKYYDFNTILKSPDPIKEYQYKVPIHNYNQIHERWWHQQQSVEDITWPGKPPFFALSSGTTGKSSKRIPITDDFLQSMREVGSSMIRSLPNYDFPETLFESEMLMLSSSANLSKNEQGHLEGEISGINVSNFPGWYDFFYRPGKEIASISNWDDRVKRIVEEAPGWNIGAIAGIPSWVLLMLQEVIKVHNLETIHDIWPNLTVYASGGVAFETYRKDFEKICKKPLTIMDTYLASEGFFSYSTDPKSMNMRLALSHGYFYEFIPFDERGVDDFGQVIDNPMTLTIDEVEMDQDYVLIISTCAGAWRYMIGDTIKFTSLDPPEIKISGRTKFFLNVVGSQLSEEKMDEAILAVSDAMGITVNEYSVSAIKDEKGAYVHQWIVVSENEIDEKSFAEQLDEALKDANKNYNVARNKALKEIRVRAIGKDLYHEFLEANKKKGGQIKTPKVMGEDRMKEFLDYTS